ncbi:MAG: hypothetical protein GXY85_02505 [Candidatus Brocadiaceae bacterium]|nr:hypothetical protein [Candidatus Brocadiaceae bacterium]
MARAVLLAFFVLAFVSGPAAGQVLDVHDRTYVVVGRCDHPTYSARLALGPLPGRESVDGLSVLFGADEAGRGYRFEADRTGWALHCLTAAGPRELAAGSRSPLPQAGPLTLLIKRRAWLVTVAADGHVLAEVADADRLAGDILAVDPALCAPAGEPVLQAVAALRFADTFMRPQDEMSLGQWTAQCGLWQLHSVRDDPESTRAAGEGKEPQNERSANPFCISGSADGVGVLTTGYWFWDDFDLTAALRNEGADAAGLAFDVRGPDDMFVLRWDGVRETTGPTPIRLLRVKGGETRELACAWVNGRREQWYRLAVRTCGRRIRAYLDDAPILDLRSDECIGGLIGLYVQGGDADNAAVFDDVHVRSVTAYDFDDPVWLERHTTSREGRWDVREAARPARPANWAAVLRDRDGRMTMGHAGWPDARVSASVSMPAPGQTIGFDLGLNDAGVAAVRIALSCDADGPHLTVFTMDGTPPVSAAACRDLPVTDGGTLALAADLTRPGELNVYVEGRLCLHVPRETPGAGGVRVFAEGFPEATFRDLRVAFEREEDQERLPQAEIFRDDPFMKHWSSPEGAWWPVEGRGDAWWHVGDFYGRSEIELPMGGRASVIHCATEIAQASGYCLAQKRAEGGRVRLTLLRLGDGVAAVTLEPAQVEAGRLVVCREAPYLWVTVGGREVLTFRDPDPLPGRKVALTGVSKDQLAGLNLRRFQVKDYYFEEAPADWIRVGDWRITTRFTCDPRWSFMTALATQNAALHNKYVYSGDVTIEAHMGPRMATRQMGSRYWRVGDYNLALCAEPGRLDSGYNFIVAGWDPAWSDSVTYMLKGSECLARTTERLLPNVRREDTQQRVLPVPWISSGRPIHGAWYYIKARKQGGELASYVDNHPACTFVDPEPIDRFAPAVWTYDATIVVARVKISYETREVPGRLVPAPEEMRVPETGPRVPAPLIVSRTHPGFFDDFEGGPRGWHTYEGQQSAVPEIVDDVGSPGRRFLRVTNTGGGGLFEAIAPLGDARIRPADVHTVSFRYRIPPEVRVNLYFKQGDQYYYVHMTGPDEESAFYRRLGRIAVEADDRWHEARFPLGSAYRGADGPADGRLENAVFGNLHRGLLQAGIGGNGPGLAYGIDDFRVTSKGPADFGAECRSADVPEGAVVGTIDRHPLTIPGAEGPLRRDSLDGGEWFCHARVRRADGTVSGVAHLPFFVAAEPLALAAAEPAEGAAWGLGPIALRMNSHAAPFLDPTTLSLEVDGQAIELRDGLFEVDWPAARLRIDLAGTGLVFEDGQEVALAVTYKDTAGRSGSFATSLTASRDADVNPPTPVVLDGYLPGEDFETGRVAWEGSRDTALLLDASTAASGRRSLKVQNLRWGSAFTAFARRGRLNAGAYPLLEFDCRAAPGVQFDLTMPTVRGNATVGISDGARHGTFLGNVSGFEADDTWRRCEFNLLEGLKKLPYAMGVFEQRWVALGDFGYRANSLGASYNIDNFRFVPLVTGCGEVTLRWHAHDVGGVAGYSYRMSAAPDDSPDDEIDTVEGGATFTDLPVPDAYLHVKARDRAGNWGPVRSFRFRVDGTPPVFARTSPGPDVRSASSRISVAVEDKGSAVDPDTLILKVNGRSYRPHSPGVDYDLQTGQMVWDWVVGRPQDERHIPDGTTMQLEVSAADFAGNPMDTHRWQWVMDHSLDGVPPTRPALASATGLWVPQADFEEGIGQWQVKPGGRGFALKRVQHDAAIGGHCLEIAASQDNAALNLSAWRGEHDLTGHALLCFDLCMATPVAADMHVQVNAAWYTVTMTGPRPAFQVIGSVPGSLADGQWHHVCVDLLEMVRKVAPEASAYRLTAVDFRDDIRGANNRNARMLVDNLAFAAYGDPQAEFTWQSEDITGVEGYSVVVDRQMHTIPPREVTATEEAGGYRLEEPGTHWVHVIAHDGNGNWSPAGHMPYHVRARAEADAAPVTEPAAEAP